MNVYFSNYKWYNQQENHMSSILNSLQENWEYVLLLFAIKREKKEVVNVSFQLTS